MVALTAWISRGLISQFENMSENFILFCRMRVIWSDERYKLVNEHRAYQCESNEVFMQERNQFWFPNLMVPDALELVSHHQALGYKLLYAIILSLFRGFI